MPKQEYDEQGKLWWHYAMYAGWSPDRLQALLLKKWNVTHWMALQPNEKRAALNMMKAYAKKAEKERAKKVRQMIMARVAKAGHDLDWLHQQMEVWGAGDSLRKLSLKDLQTVYDTVLALFPGRVAKAEEVK